MEVIIPNLRYHQYLAVATTVAVTRTKNRNSISLKRDPESIATRCFFEYLNQIIQLFPRQFNHHPPRIWKNFCLPINGNFYPAILFQDCQYRSTSHRVPPHKVQGYLIIHHQNSDKIGLSGRTLIQYKITYPRKGDNNVC